MDASQKWANEESVTRNIIEATNSDNYNKNPIPLNPDPAGF